MSEKRKPYLTLLLRKEGKKSKKVELFDATLWDPKWGGRRYRLRVNGKWVGNGPNKSYFYMTEFRDMLFRSLKNI